MIWRLKFTNFLELSIRAWTPCRHINVYFKTLMHCISDNPSDGDESSNTWIMEVAWIRLIKMLKPTYAEMRKLTDGWIQKHRNNNLKNKINNTTELLSTTLLYFISTPCHGSKTEDAVWPPLTYPIVHCVLMCLHTGENKMRISSIYEWTPLNLEAATQHVSNFRPRSAFKAKTSFNNESRF